MEIVTDFRCEECGFDNTTMDNAALVEAIASQARRYRAPLTRGLPGEDLDALLRTRPAPDVWSALEYAVHQREVIGFYAARIDAVLTHDGPQLEGFGFAEAADRDGYNDEDPAKVAEQIATGATAAAERLTALSEDQWERVGIATDGTSERNVRNLASRLAHEGGHHLLDIGRSMRAARS